MSEEAYSSPAAVGVRLLRAAAECSEVPVYEGVSYYDAVHRTGQNKTLHVLPDSIQMCQ